MSKPSFFQVFLDKESLVDMLSDRDAGRLFKAMFAFAKRVERADFSHKTELCMMYELFTQQIERNFEHYAEVCEKNRKNIQKRYSSTTVYDRREEEEKKEKKEEEEKEEDKEEEKDPAFVGGADARAALPDFNRVMDSYNECCHSLPKVRKLTDRRKRLIEKAEGLLGDNSFEELFRRVENSDFLSGRSEKWTGCSFDWLLREDNLVRVLEGVFDNPVRCDFQRSYDIDELDKINTDF